MHRIVLALAAFVVMGCTPVINARGYLPDPDAEAAIGVGKDTKTTVQQRLGYPSTEATFNGDAWYYISSVEKADRVLPSDGPVARNPRRLFRQGRQGHRSQALQLARRPCRRVRDPARRRPKAASSPSCSSCSTRRLAFQSAAAAVRAAARPIQAAVAAADPREAVAATHSHGKARGTHVAARFSYSTIRMRAPTSPAASSATMLVILIIGLTAGPAVSL